MKTAVILAGGKGTRLAEVRADVPKPMMPVLGKPLLAYQIDLLKAHGFTTVWLIVNHMYEHIESYFSDGKDFGVDIKYYVEEKPLGTVGGVKAIEAQLKEPFLVLYGDVLMDMDLSRLVAFHHNKNADATLVVHPNDHPYDSDLLAVDNESRVTAFYAKPHPEGLRYRNLVNAAAYVFDPVVLEHLEPGVKADFGKDIFPTLHSKLNVFAYNTPEYLKDMGTPDRLEKVEEALKSGKVAARNLNNKQRCVFLDRDGVINIDTDLIDRPEDLELYPYGASSIRRLNKMGFLVVVVTNQSVIARGLCTIATLDEIHKKMETELGQDGAFVEAIYYCPHHPHSGYEGEIKEFKVECSCRKPKPGMLLEAADRFNIDLTQSYLVGDSPRDIEAGANAGVETIRVKTGHGLKPHTTVPKHYVEDLVSAVDLIENQFLKA
ncbi:D-glycero-beta-D-manno-heptose 1,7-bisphosphate 7-phosphatase [Schleiferiaceae bacterium]|nr:D-glycero-beta-D-manno-heptose 1,7-bisphosphate 7-phosphatase [Schleiferiaceae bacterium]MDC1493480.1 D-glycero-beta-D-manno-heptose 1,7-bisphosphate 7-phosphatase [Schleiferiaceae bacterium]